MATAVAKMKQIEHTETVAISATSDPVFVPGGVGRVTVTIDPAAGAAHKAQFTTTPMETITKTAIMDGTPTLAFADANPDTVTRSAGSWITDGFVEGMSVTFYGPGNDNHNKSYTIGSGGVAATILTLEAGDAVTAESATSGYVIVRGVITPSADTIWQDWAAGAVGATTSETIAVDPIAVRAVNGGTGTLEFEVASER